MTQAILDTLYSLIMVVAFIVGLSVIIATANNLTKRK